MNTPDIPFHEVANLFPLMTGQPFTDLVADIREHGQREPGWTLNGAIIDGRNRYRACREAGVLFQAREWDGDPAALVAFIVSLNLKRRHLDESQRAIVAAKVSNMKRGRPKENRPIGLVIQPAENPPIGGFKSPHVAQAEAAKLMNVGERSVQRAEKVLCDGVPSLVEAVEKGEAKVSAAAAVSTLPPPVQEQIVAAGPAEIVRVARQVREERKAERVDTHRAPREPDPDRPLGGDELYLAWDKMLRAIHLQVTSHDPADVKLLAEHCSLSVRESEVERLDRLIAPLNNWKSILEKSNA